MSMRMRMCLKDKRTNALGGNVQLCWPIRERPAASLFARVFKVSAEAPRRASGVVRRADGRPPHQQRASLTFLVETFGSSVRAEHSHIEYGLLHDRSQTQLTAGDDRRVANAPPYVFVGVDQGEETGRAGRVHVVTGTCDNSNRPSVRLFARIRSTPPVGTYLRD